MTDGNGWDLRKKGISLFTLRIATMIRITKHLDSPCLNFLDRPDQIITDFHISSSKHGLFMFFFTLTAPQASDSACLPPP